MAKQIENGEPAPTPAIQDGHAADSGRFRAIRRLETWLQTVASRRFSCWPYLLPALRAMVDASESGRGPGGCPHTED